VGIHHVELGERVEVRKIREIGEIGAIEQDYHVSV